MKLLIQHQVQLEIENNVSTHINIMNYKFMPHAYNYQEGRTALLVACWEGHYDIACQLLQAGANPNAQDQVGGCGQITLC